MLKDDEDQKAKRYLIGTILGVFPITIFLILLTYIYLIMGENSFKWALIYAFVNMLFALLSMFGNLHF